MKNDAHPGRSIEFLSRLHDGELSAGERARFESHRAHCAECRRAAVEFESALSLYRSAPTSPAAPDLAGRILRRLQTAAPARRRPFGIFHGIDVRWAGAFAAALLAMIIGSAVVVRQQAVPGAKAPATPIPVRLGKSAEQTQAANAAPPAAQDRRMADAAPRRNDADAGAAKESKTVDSLETANQPADDRFGEREPLAAPPAAPAAAAAAPKEKDAQHPVSERQEGAAGRIASRDEASGGERSAAAAQDLAAAQLNVAFRLEITALDGEGTPPRTLQEPELSPEHRGRSYEIVVSASGQVLHVLPREEEETRLRAQQEGAKRQKLERPMPRELTGLRFEAGNGPRRLLLTVR